MKPGVNTVDFSPYVQEIISNQMVRHNSYRQGYSRPEEIALHGVNYATHIHGLIPVSLTGLLLNHVRQFDWLPVGDDGFANKTFDEVGSYRLSNFNPDWAKALWNHFQNHDMMLEPREFNHQDKTDWDGHSVWKPIGINPLFRFIRYKGEGKLVGHYDAPYVESDTVRSLQTLIIYLTGHPGPKRESHMIKDGQKVPVVSGHTRGSTRFINDLQFSLPVPHMDLSDWDRPANSDEVLRYVLPQGGDALIFDHRILHDSEPLAADDAEKIIIRTDIMFEKVPV